jgi:6-phosphogluconolactonase
VFDFVGEGGAAVPVVRQSLITETHRGGSLAARQTVSTLPPGFAGSNFCSEILVSADGRFVYAGNRLHDSIGVFSIGPRGILTYVGEEWTRGDYPRSFIFDLSGV